MRGETRTVAVIGAGIAGLGAAWRLSRRGLDVTLFERAERPGGRAVSESAEGFTLEAAGSVISAEDRQLLSWIAEVGLRDELLPLRPVVVAQLHRGRVVEIDPRGLLGIGRIPGVRALHALRLARLPRLMSRFGARTDPRAPERAADLDDRSLGDFGRLYFGRSVLERWMVPFAASGPLGDENETSRVLFLRRYRAHGRARLGLLRAALGELPKAVAAKLPVTYGAEATRLERRADGGLALALTVRGAERRIEPAAVVVATSAPDALRLAAPALVAAERRGLAAVRYQPAVSLAVGLRRPFFPHPRQIQVPRNGDSPLEKALLEPGVPGGRVPGGRGLATLWARGAWSEAHIDAPEPVLREELLSAFARIFPGVRSAVGFTQLFRVERALPRFEVGRFREIARFERAQRELRREGRRLYFAGDYLMDPSLNGALVSAERTAAAVAADLAPL